MENKRYSLLVIALYCYTGHIKGIVNHLKSKNPLVDVTLLTDNPEEMKHLLEDKSVNVVTYNVSPVKCKYRWLRSWMIKMKQILFFSKFSKNKEYDIVNVHFPNIYMSYVYKYLRRMSKNIVISPWGSDILRRDKKYLNHLAGLYENADYIATAKNTPLGKRIIEVFNIDPKRIVGNFFGTDIVDFAIKNGDSISQEDAKLRFGLNGKYVITCGYNQRRQQRHKEIIVAISKVKNQLPQNLTLLFPMSYGKTQNETDLDECKILCREYGLDALFITDFLKVNDLYMLRKATDMFVHVQTTDAGSATIQEYILCEKKIVHGSWMKYEALEAFKPLFYFPVDRLEDLGKVIVNAYNSDKIEIPQGVFDIIKNSGWDYKSTLMNNFFMSIVS